MQIWVDADACPKVVKEILFRAAERLQVMLVLVANHALRVPPSRFIRSVMVPGGFDVADDYIAREMQAGDLVITADIPLASEVLNKDGVVISPRGERFTENNIRERLTIRDFMEEMRSSGQHSGGPAAFSQADRRNFANELDRFFARMGKP